MGFPNILWTSFADARIVLTTFRRGAWRAQAFLAAAARNVVDPLAIRPIIISRADRARRSIADGTVRIGNDVPVGLSTEDGAEVLACRRELRPLRVPRNPRAGVRQANDNVSLRAVSR